MARDCWLGSSEAGRLIGSLSRVRRSDPRRCVGFSNSKFAGSGHRHCTLCYSSPMFAGLYAGFNARLGLQTLDSKIPGQKEPSQKNQVNSESSIHSAL